MGRSTISRLYRWLQRDNHRNNVPVTIYPMDGVTSPTTITEALVGDSKPQEAPTGEVLIADVTEESAELLRESAAGLKERRRNVHPCLIAIPHDMDVVNEVAECFQKTILVDEENRELIDELLPFIPALFHKSVRDISGTGSVRLSTIDVHDCPPNSAALGADIRDRKGQPLHECAGHPDLFTFAAPPAYQETVYLALVEIAPIADQQTLDEAAQVIKIVGFNFD